MRISHEKVLIITPEDWETLKAQLGDSVGAVPGEVAPGEIVPGSAMEVILSRFAPPGGALLPALVTKPFDFERDMTIHCTDLGPEPPSLRAGMRAWAKREIEEEE